MVAGADNEQAAALRQALQPFVAENRVLLAPNGEVGRALLEYRDAWREVKQRLDAIDAAAKPTAPLQGPAEADGALERVQGQLTGWLSAKRLIQP